MSLIPIFGGFHSATSDPSSISGLYCWLRSDYGLYTDTGKTTPVSAGGDAVAAWADKSGNSRDFTQATSGNRPTYQTSVLNSQPSVRFDGSDDFMTASTWAGLTAAEVFIVVKIDTDPPGGSGQTGLWTFNNADYNTAFPWTSGTVFDSAFSSARKTTVDPTPSLSSTFRLYNVVSASGEWTSFLDGTQLSTTGTNTVAAPTTPAIGRSVGADPTTYLDGDIVEMIVYSAKLSGTDKNTVESYVASRYGLTIA